MARTATAPQNAEARDGSVRDALPDSMMLAYRSLRANEQVAGDNRKSLVAALLMGSNAAWAWFALRDLASLTTDERTALCRIVAKAGDCEIALWCLDETGLTIEQRTILKNVLLNQRVTSFAHRALERVPDFSETQRARLRKIAEGMDPDA